MSGTAPDVQAGSGTYVGISVLRRALEVLGCTVDFAAPAAGSGPVSLAGRYLFNLSVRRIANRLRPDVVVGFDWDGLFVAGAGIPHIASIKGVIAEEARFEHGIPRLRLSMEARLEERHVRRADRVLATSLDSASRITARYGVPPDRIAIVAEPIDLRRWRDAFRDAETLPRAAAGGLAILCVAHLYPRKDVATLLDAMARLPEDVRLRVVGNGPELSRLRQRVRTLALDGRVELLGHVPFARLAAEYRRADVFCLPSRQEGFGIVFLEAMAAGLPIVAARAAAVPEVVSDGECGILIEPGNSAELASVIEGLRLSLPVRRRLSEGGRQRVDRYDAPNVARQFLGAIGVSAPSPSPRP